MTTLEEVSRRHRGELVRTAYGMLGSVADAEDAAQDALLRLHRHGLDDVARPGAWLARTLGRICLDRLRSARHRRETYVGEWLPEPVVEPVSGPLERVEAAESVSFAFLVLLETLTPPQRIALLLHDVLGHGYDDLAEVLDRSPGACRQLVARARAAVRSGRPRFERDPAERDAAVWAFLAAATGGGVEDLVAVLADDVVVRSDGGGVVAAARRPVRGADRSARFVRGLLASRGPDDPPAELARVNGTLGVVLRDRAGTIRTVVAFDVAAGRVREIGIVRAPDKLAHLAGTPPGAPLRA